MSPRRRAPKKSQTVPEGLFADATCFILHVAGDPAGTVVFGDLLEACDEQRLYDPKMTWIVRHPDGAVLKVRNASSAQLRQIVARHGGHL